MPARTEKTDAQGKALTADKRAEPMALAVTRREATEPAFSGRLATQQRAGNHRCICCGRLLFASETKYDSGTGWPGFCQPVDMAAIATRVDGLLSMKRTEVHCKDCGAHLGHVFADGPPPTGLRYCMKSASLEFEPA